MFSLIELPYKSLAPVISDETLSFHHGKHLQTYVDNLNKLIAGTEYEKMSLEEIVVASSLPAPTGNPAVFNNAGQILNHNLYFSQFVMPGSDRASGTPHPGLDPGSPLCKQIVKQWGSVDSFKADFESKGTTLFGSGWVWLSANPDGTLVITQETNANNPITRVMPGQTGHLRPLLTFDVWEHAYYLDYQNKRAAHLGALWNIINWTEIEKRYSN